MPQPNLKKPYERQRQTLSFEGVPSLVDRSFGNDTDVNKIVARFARTGILPDGDPGQYADVTGLQEELTTLIDKSRTALEEYNQAEKALEQKQKEQIVENAKIAQEFKEYKAKQAAAMKPKDQEGTD